jgi:hypothetical protein
MLLPLCSRGLLPSCHGSFPASSCVHSVHETLLPGFHRLHLLLSHSDIVWARSSFRAVSGLLPAVTAVEELASLRFQLNVWRSLPAVTLDVSSSCRPKPPTRRTPLELCVAGYTCTTRRVHALQLASHAGKAALMAVGLPAGPLRQLFTSRIIPIFIRLGRLLRGRPACSLLNNFKV